MVFSNFFLDVCEVTGRDKRPLSDPLPKNGPVNSISSYTSGQPLLLPRTYKSSVGRTDGVSDFYSVVFDDKTVSEV